MSGPMTLRECMHLLLLLTTAASCLQQRSLNWSSSLNESQTLGVPLHTDVRDSLSISLETRAPSYARPALIAHAFLTTAARFWTTPAFQMQDTSVWGDSQVPEVKISLVKVSGATMTSEVFAWSLITAVKIVLEPPFAAFNTIQTPNVLVRQPLTDRGLGRIRSNVHPIRHATMAQRKPPVQNITSFMPVDSAHGLIEFREIWTSGEIETSAIPSLLILSMLESHLYPLSWADLLAHHYQLHQADLSFSISDGDGVEYTLKVRFINFQQAVPARCIDLERIFRGLLLKSYVQDRPQFFGVKAFLLDPLRRRSADPLVEITLS